MKLGMSPGRRTAKGTKKRASRSLENTVSKAREAKRVISPVNDFSGCDDMVSDTDSISKDSNNDRTRSGSRTKNHSELLNSKQRRHRLKKTAKSSESSQLEVIRGSISPKNVQSRKVAITNHSNQNHFTTTSAGGNNQVDTQHSPSLRHSISNKEKQNWKLTQGRRDMVENQS